MIVKVQHMYMYMYIARFTRGVGHFDLKSSKFKLTPPAMLW